MPSSPTTRNRFMKQATGEGTNIWGRLLNDSVIDLIDESLDGVVNIRVSGTVRLSDANYVTDIPRNRVLKLSGYGGNLEFPAVEKFYVVRNGCSGTVRFNNKGFSSTASLASGFVDIIFTDGTRFYTSGGATNIANGSVTNSRLASMPGGRIKGRLAGSSGSPIDLIPSQVIEMLGLEQGIDVQKYHSNLQALSEQNISGRHDVLMKYTTPTVVDPITLSPFVQSLFGLTTDALVRNRLDLGTIATQNLSSVNIIGGTVRGITDITIADGGTGASDVASARSNLGLGSLATRSTINSTNWSGTDLAIEHGGTGASSASGARTNLELGDMATRDKVDNDNWGVEYLTIDHGGTGVNTATKARTALGLKIGLNVQAYYPVSSVGKELMEDSTASRMRTTLGLGSIATQASNSVNITGGSVAGIADISISDGGTGASDSSSARNNLGLGTLATKSNVNSTNWSGSDLAIEHGGTGASSTSAARANLELRPGLDVLRQSDVLDNFGRLRGSDNKGIYFTGSDSFATFPLTAKSREFMKSSDAGDMRNIMQLKSGALFTATGAPTPDTVVLRTPTGDVQAVDFNLTSDLRLKKDVVALNGEDMLAGFRLIRGFSFTAAGRKGLGVIAQHLADTPFACLTREGADGYLSVAYNGFTGPLIAAVTALDERVRKLEAALAAHGQDKT